MSSYKEPMWICCKINLGYAYINWMQSLDYLHQAFNTELKYKAPWSINWSISWHLHVCTLAEPAVIAYSPTFASPVQWDQADWLTELRPLQGHNTTGRGNCGLNIQLDSSQFGGSWIEETNFTKKINSQKKSLILFFHK